MFKRGRRERYQEGVYRTVGGTRLRFPSESRAEAYEQGFNAKKEGKKRDDNPYPKGSDERSEWINGFEDEDA